jgi:hypothetical protein
MLRAWNTGYEQADLLVPAVLLIAMLSDPAASVRLIVVVESLDYVRSPIAERRRDWRAEISRLLYV